MTDTDMKQEYTDEEIARRTSEFLDRIDILSYVDEYAVDCTLSSLMYDIDSEYENSEETDNDFFCGYVFNWWGEDDFRDYLGRRYGDSVRMIDHTETYIQISRK